MNAKTYKTSTAFRSALEERLKNFSTQNSVDLQEVRRRVGFERLLCRLFVGKNAHWVLKGGYAMELRLRFARATRDIDLTLLKDGLPKDVRRYDSLIVSDMLRKSASQDLQDHFIYLIGDAMHSLDNAPYGGERYPIDARVDGRTFVKFHLDVSFGDGSQEPFELLDGEDWLDFASIKTGSFPSISSEDQFSEKLHAYTLPREGKINSRVKDLIDMVLLIEQGNMDPIRLKHSIKGLFSKRKTHDISENLPLPPDFWEITFKQMAKSCAIEEDITIQHQKVDLFLKNQIHGKTHAL